MLLSISFSYIWQIKVENILTAEDLNSALQMTNTEMHHSSFA